DVEVSRPNPVNAIGVLSRSDEIGVGRIDSMASARRIAARLATDANVRRVVQTVVPVAGLLAETAVTLTETEVAQLRRVAELPVKEADELLLSADRFAQLRPELGLTSIEREALLDRFGLFGIRLGAALLRRGVASTATELARELAERSGLGELQDVLGSLFFERRDVLKSRSALLALDALTRAETRPGSAALAAEIEEIIASAHPFNELRVLSAVRAGWVAGKPDVVTDLERVIGGGGGALHLRLQLAAEASPADLTAAATAALQRWQRRAENPLTAHEMVIAARVAVRSCEGMLADLARTA
ncbi:MAG: GTP-binding protein, partial [Micromonosporaceae bacterium]